MKTVPTSITEKKQIINWYHSFFIVVLLSRKYITDRVLLYLYFEKENQKYVYNIYV